MIDLMDFWAAVHGVAEGWTVKKAERQSIDAFGLWCWRRPEKAKAPHPSTLAWKIPWAEESGGLQSMGSLGVGHN